MSLNDDNTPKEDHRNGFEKAVDNITGAFNRTSNRNLGTKPDTPEKDPSPATLAFFKAVKNNRLQDVSALLAEGVDPNAYDKNGNTALHIAARGNLAEMITLLIESGATPTRGKDGNPDRTPLEDAVNYGSNNAVILLARLGGFIPGHHINGWTLLHRATEKGKAPAVAALLAAGADANERTNNGATPLLIAISRRQPEITAMLLDHPGVIDGLNDFYADTDESKRNAFHLAIERGETAAVGKMIAKGALVNKPDDTGETPLEKAILGADPEIVRLLVQAGADLNKPAAGKETPLMTAITASEIRDEAARAAIITCLLAAGADPDILSPLSGMAPLHAAIQAADGKKSLQALLQYPLQLEIHDKNGDTPLFHALRRKDHDILTQLLQQGAHVNARNTQDAKTPLITAVCAGNTQGVALLLQRNANPALCDAANSSALSHARRTKGTEEIIGLLEKALHVRQSKKMQHIAKARPSDNGHWTF